MHVYSLMDSVAHLMNQQNWDRRPFDTTKNNKNDLLIKLLSTFDLMNLHLQLCLNYKKYLIASIVIIIKGEK